MLFLFFFTLRCWSDAANLGVLVLEREAATQSAAESNTHRHTQASLTFPNDSHTSGCSRASCVASVWLFIPEGVWVVCEWACEGKWEGEGSGKQDGLFCEGEGRGTYTHTHTQALLNKLIDCSSRWEETELTTAERWLEGKKSGQWIQEANQLTSMDSQWTNQRGASWSWMWSCPPAKKEQKPGGTALPKGSGEVGEVEEGVGDKKWDWGLTSGARSGGNKGRWLQATWQWPAVKLTH